MSKRVVILNIKNCGDYSVIGALAKYWGGTIPRGYAYYPHEINCAPNEYQKVREQCQALGLLELNIIEK